MSLSKPRILFFNPVRHALAAYEALHKVAAPEVVTSKSRPEFFTDIKSKYHDIQAIYRTSASGAVAGKFDKEFIDQLPTSLKFICHTGAGYDQIDVDACARRNITVTYAPDPVTNATADLTLFLLLGAIRQLNPSFSNLRNGNFKKGIEFGHDPQGKTLGILGMGRIGRAVKRRAEPFGLKVVYHNRNPLPDDLAAGCPYVSFDELLSTSDIISVHVPLSAATTHLIGAAEIARMKPGVVIINTARGAIIDEAAMAAALDEGHVAAVGLDVYEREPLVDERLVKNDRALLVPHLGTHTVETLTQMESLAMENARRGEAKGETWSQPSELEKQLMNFAQICRPQCKQCGINNVTCQWPQPQKRGPPKNHTAALEKRLIETENILFALMAQVSDEQLASACHHMAQVPMTGARPSNSKPFDSTQSSNLRPVYWTNYPLNSVEDARRWWTDRASKMSHNPQPHQSEDFDLSSAEANDTIICDSSLESAPERLGRTACEDAAAVESFSPPLGSSVVTSHGDVDQTMAGVPFASSISLLHEARGPSSPLREQTPARSRPAQSLPLTETESYEDAYLW
ncbi:hypothetical protein NM208_g5299 [Fusarium decemcellulare]|uniref:Uncharacterized protein n=1 Tax=Fusarium decemcellulare TaxID=57161 RepID=A0ACC1SHH9_9HYPO|nr:hypothetical protein NM208_g5299 [Fusarium decemcellulare]